MLPLSFLASLVFCSPAIVSGGTNVASSTTVGPSGGISSTAITSGFASIPGFGYGACQVAQPAFHTVFQPLYNGLNAFNAPLTGLGACSNFDCFDGYYGQLNTAWQNYAGLYLPYQSCFGIYGASYHAQATAFLTYYNLQANAIQTMEILRANNWHSAMLYAATMQQTVINMQASLVGMAGVAGCDRFW